jgi:predicted nucleotidyltransferase
MSQIKILPEIKTLLDNIANKTEKLFGDNFVGLYVHGSIAMNCFNPLVSDVDFLVVVHNKMSIEGKRGLANILLNEKYNVPKGIEMSVVLLQYTQNPVFPTPFEFHFGKEWAEKYRRNEIDFSKENSDPDLAAHFTVIKKRGITWRGLPIDEVFSDIQKEFYVKSLLYDFDDLDKNILANPVYGILNACRTIPNLKDNLALSKKEGGEWALKNFDKQYFPIVRQALSSYETGEKFLELDNEMRDSFVRYVKGLVEKFS